MNYVGSQAIVTVNNSSGCGAQANQIPTIRHITVTPLITTPTTQVTSIPITLHKLLIKAVCKGKKKETLVKSLL